MKKTIKPANQQNAEKQSAQKTRKAKRAGKVLAAVLTGTAVFTPLALSGCPTELEYRDVLVPTYPEITIPIRFFSETMNIVCPGNLMDESYTKILGAITYLEDFFNGNAIVKGNYNALLSGNEVKIVVKNDNSVANCEKTDSFTMTINYQWLLASNDTDIGVVISPVFTEMMVDAGISKANDLQFDDARQAIRLGAQGCLAPFLVHNITAPPNRCQALFFRGNASGSAGSARVPR
jgi:hypothetical protein